jgi:hypothetical protein
LRAAVAVAQLVLVVVVQAAIELQADLPSVQAPPLL